MWLLCGVGKALSSELEGVLLYFWVWVFLRDLTCMLGAVLVFFLWLVIFGCFSDGNVLRCL